MDKIPIIINNRNYLTWPKAMVETIKTFDEVGEIIIIDNGSTYPPLLEWYKTNPCTIVKIDNTGHKAPWSTGIVSNLKADYFVVTDPDLGLDRVPKDVLTFLRQKLINNPGLGKVGLQLDSNIPSDSPWVEHMEVYEKSRWAKSRVSSKDPDVYIDVAVDTTFALYNRKTTTHWIGGGSVKAPYIANHFPWEISNHDRVNNSEFQYYLQNANKSSSYVQYAEIHSHKFEINA